MHIDSWLNTQYAKYTPTDGRLNCPYCDERKHHLYVSLSQPVFFCFRCGATGSWVNLVSTVEGIPFRDALAILQGRVPVSEWGTVADMLSRKGVAPIRNHTNEMPDFYSPIAHDNGSRLRSVILRYALTRFTADEIVRYGIGYCAKYDPKYSLRMLIPIEGGLFQGRALSDASKPRYLHEEDIGDRLFNYEALEENEEVIVAEGVISAIRCGSNAIATLGTGLNHAQLKRLIKASPRRVIFAADPGTLYHNRIVENVKALSANGIEVVIRHYQGGDPAESSIYEEIECSPGYEVRSRLHIPPKKHGYEAVGQLSLSSVLGTVGRRLFR